MAETKIAYAVIQCANQDKSPQPTKISSKGIATVSAETEKGIFHVQFESGFFNSVPAVTVTQAYNGRDSGDLNPITGVGGSDTGSTRDNALVINVEQDYVRIKTGNDGGDGRYRSFCIQAVGN